MKSGKGEQYPYVKDRLVFCQEDFCDNCLLYPEGVVIKRRQIQKAT